MLKHWLSALFGARTEQSGAAPLDAAFPPEVLVIPHDDHHGRFVGKLPNGEGVFITTPFTSGSKPQDSREFLALYRFSPTGDLLEARIESLGSRADLVGARCAAALPGNVAADNPTVQSRIEVWLQQLPGLVLGDIVAKPFCVHQHGLNFGLIPDSPDDCDADEAFDPVYVTLLPGDYMAFMAPWDGSYDT